MARVDTDVIRGQADLWMAQVPIMDRISNLARDAHLTRAAGDLYSGLFAAEYESLTYEVATKTAEGRDAMAEIRDRLWAIAAMYDAHEKFQKQRFERLLPQRPSQP